MFLGKCPSIQAHAIIGVAQMEIGMAKGCIDPPLRTHRRFVLGRLLFAATRPAALEQ
jgi:hypothetical protein